MEKGLSIQEVKDLQKEHGKNEISDLSSFSALSLFLSQFPTLINAILISAAILAFFIGEIIDSMFIVGILILNAVFGFIQEYRAEKALEKLKDYIKQSARVLRDGKEEKIAASDIVPSDIVILSEGERISADGIIITHHSVEIDESLLTGESLPVVKNYNDEIFSGTLIIKGNAHIRVTKTGLATQFGQIANTLASVESDKTPLQKRLNYLAKILSLIILLTAALLIPIGILQGKDVFPLALLAISIGIAAIPEGLPAVITIALALGTNRMAKKYAVVRKMQAIETLGAVQIILTDKTGTLTQNLMRVKKVWTYNKEYLNYLYKACVLGNTASLLQTSKTNVYNTVGDKTDGALLLWSHQSNENIEDIKQNGTIIEEYAFDPETKTVTTVWEEKNKRHAFVRGAPEEILKKSRLSENEKEKVKKEFETSAKEGLRIIGFGEKLLKPSELIKRENVEKDLIFLGFVGIYDPPREEVKKSIKEARLAGIHTVMVTGDNEFTALTIAKEIGLIEKDEDVITGDYLQKFSDEELEKIIEKTRIFARTRPEDKLRLVSLFKKLGYVVGVTGDGVNDALALKRADVGIAMGESGTDVAKEASDIVLLDDNYSTLVRAVEEGRTIYNNIVKSITYLLAGNFSEISFVFLATVLGMPNPLFPTQILWINLVTDSIPAFALASDNKDPGVLKRKPRNPDSPILSKNRLIFIVFVGLTLSIFLLVLFKLLLGVYEEKTARTIVFNALVISHMGIAFLVRGKAIFRKNKALLIGVAAILLLQAFITLHPVSQKILHLGF